MLYDRPVRLLLRDAVDEMPASFTAADITDWFEARYPKLKVTTVRAHITAATVNSPSRIHYAEVGDLLFRRADRRLERYDASRHGWWRDGRLVTPPPGVEPPMHEDRPPTGPEAARDEGSLLSGYFGTDLTPHVLELREGVTHRFDLVAPDVSVVGSVVELPRGSTPEACWTTIGQEVWLLGQIPGPSTRFLAFPSDEQVARLWLSHFGRLAQDVVFLGMERGTVRDLRDDD